MRGLHTCPSFWKDWYKGTSAPIAVLIIPCAPACTGIEQAYLSPCSRMCLSALFTSGILRRRPNMSVTYPLRRASAFLVL